MILGEAVFPRESMWWIREVLFVSACANRLMRNRVMRCWSSGEALGTIAPYTRRRGSPE